MVVKVGVAKLGNIAAGVMAELLLDERADREDMMTFMATSGTKLQKEDVDRVVSNLKHGSRTSQLSFPRTASSKAQLVHEKNSQQQASRLSSSLTMSPPRKRDGKHSRHPTSDTSS